ncbi:ABC transporter substrate-binding protein [Paenibacillus sp. NPDC057967]|uniref:ABC transporter substrate-binding protein n=1 Tax=Paenibacillus sp. NPDC057967 TaxID=3346293 RepID=UPI0036DB1D4D
MNRLLSRLSQTTLFLSLLILLAACSSSSTSTPAKTPEESTNTSIESEAPATTKMYKDYEGRETEIPVNPQKIAVVAGSGAIIDVKELGFEPIAYPHRYMSNSNILKSTHESLSAKAPDIGMPTNLEVLVDLNPDLMIMGYETQDNEYAMLQKIGPIAGFDESVSLPQRLTAIGEILGKPDEAKVILSDLEQKTQSMWQQLRDQGKIAEGETAAVIVYYWNKKMYLMKNFGVFDLINHPMGFKMSDKVAGLASSSPSPYIEVTEEALHDTLIADRLFLLYDNNAEAKEGFKQLKESKVFQSLPPVKNGKTHYIPLEYNDNDLITTRKLIDVFPQIIESEMFEEAK